MNAMTALEWAKNTQLSEVEALAKAALKIGVQEQSIDDFIKLVHLSADGVVRGHCSLIDVPKAGFNVWWVRDHFMSGTKKLTPFFDYAIENDKVNEVIAEKQEAVSIWKEMEGLAGKINMDDAGNQEYLKVSTTYGRIKYEIVEKAFTVMLLGYQGDKSGDYEKEKIRKAIKSYDALWVEWKQLKENNISCATLYYPDAFNIDEKGVSGDQANGLGSSIDKYRGL